MKFLVRPFLTLLLCLVIKDVTSQTACPALNDNAEMQRFHPCQTAPTVTDHQGNQYKTVQIGTQCWMAENLRCTTSPTGKVWQRNPHFSLTNPLYYAYFSTHQNSQYGHLYNWTAAVDANYREGYSVKMSIPRRGICPQGWHLPTSSEWSTLHRALGGTNAAGGPMKCPSKLWYPPNNGAVNNGGFSALPAGIYTEAGFYHVGCDANFWCADQYDPHRAWYCSVFNLNTNAYTCLDYKCYACSVRCVKD